MPELFERTFVGKEGCLDTFWENASQQPWFLEHPAAQEIAADPSHCIPLRIHGDGAPVTKKSSTLFMTFCSAVVHDLPSLQSRQLMLALESKASPEMYEVMEIMAWSFKCLMDNKMPSHDHMGQPLEGPGQKLQVNPSLVITNSFYVMPWAIGSFFAITLPSTAIITEMQSVSFALP